MHTRSACLLVVALLSSTSAASARPYVPDVPLPERRSSDGIPPFRFVTATPDLTANSKLPGGISFSIHPDMAMRVSRLAGTPFGEIALYRRSPRVGEQEVDPNQPWEFQFVANLNPRNVKGNVMIILYDREDPTAVARHAFAAMWEATLPPFRYIAGRVLLDPESEGVHATHTYLLRVVQLWNQREIVLAQGSFRLE